MPHKISIHFGGGRIRVTDEAGSEVEAQRAVIYLVAGNDRPVAGITLSDNSTIELPVASLSFDDRVVAEEPTQDSPVVETRPRRRR